MLVANVLIVFAAAVTPWTSTLEIFPNPFAILVKSAVFVVAENTLMADVICRIPADKFENFVTFTPLSDVARFAMVVANFPRAFSALLVSADISKFKLSIVLSAIASSIPY